MELEKRIEELEKTVAELELEGQVQVQPKENFIPEDSDEKHYEEKIKTTC